MKNIIVAVSGGPDSMALLDKLYKKEYQIIAAHVNYGVRENSSNDQKIIIKYLKDKNIKLEVLTAEKHEGGNFQAFARELRYDFMIDLAKKYDAEEIYVGHHLDDHLETYLMQKQRGSTPTTYGLSEYSHYQDMVLVRPLLKTTKEELIQYCEENKIEYVVDESNLENDYTRNAIRNKELAYYSDDEKLRLLNEIENENKKLEEHMLKVSCLLEPYFLTKELKYLIHLEDEDLIDVLRLYLRRHSIFDISNSEYQNIVSFIRSKQNGEYQLTQNLYFSKAYQKLNVEMSKKETYSFTFDKVEAFESDYFVIQNEGETTEAVTLHEEDFPITIRNFQEGDKIEMQFGTKRVSRFFIDRKIPESERRVWPIVENASGEIILVPGLGCNLTHYSNNPSMFVVK